jgi:hypothetical protein
MTNDEREALKDEIRKETQATIHNNVMVACCIAVGAGAAFFNGYNMFLGAVAGFAVFLAFFNTDR